MSTTVEHYRCLACGCEMVVAFPGMAPLEDVECHACGQRAPASLVEKKVKWEHVVRYLGDPAVTEMVQKHLDKLGEEGWQLIAIRGYGYFSRQVKEAADERE